MPYFWCHGHALVAHGLAEAHRCRKSCAILVRLRFFMSSKIFSQAMRSVCGVLKSICFTGEHRSRRAGESDQRDARLFRERASIAMVLAVVEPAEQRIDLVFLDQAGGEGARLVRIASRRHR